MTENQFLDRPSAVQDTLTSLLAREGITLTDHEMRVAQLQVRLLISKRTTNISLGIINKVVKIIVALRK